MEGIYEAKKRGVKFGRSKIEIPKEFYNLAEKYIKNKTSLRKASKELGVSHTTFSKWLKEEGYEKGK